MMPRHTRVGFLAVLLCVGPVCGQTGNGEPVFEVASVKPAIPVGPRHQPSRNDGPGTADPGQFTDTNTSLVSLLMKAYGPANDQIDPEWLRTSQYSIAAKTPTGTSKEQFQLMLQNLLAERFGLVVHHVSKAVPGWNLVVANGGPKLTKFTVADAANAPGGLMPHQG